MSKLVPPPIEILTIPVVQNATVITAAKLGIFKALASKPLSIKDLASELSLNEFGLTCLVEVLVSMNYVEKQGDLYLNRPMVATWLTGIGPIDFSPYYLWMAEVWHLLNGLPDIVKNGGPKQTTWSVMEEKTDMGLVFSKYMKAVATLLSEAVAQTITLPSNAKRFIDLGGSHGLYTVAFTKRNPGLQATVYDLSAALKETPTLIAKAGLSDSIKIQEGNYLTDDIGKGYDAVLCSALLHNHTAEENQGLIKKAWDALNPGGIIIIQEFMRTDPPDEFNTAFSIMMLLHSGTRTYTHLEVNEWLEKAGFAQIKRFDKIPQNNPQSILVGVK